MTETRYQREKERKNAQARHDRIVGRLADGFVDQFRAALRADTERPCHQHEDDSPNRWYDWHSDPEVREDYETDMPTKAEAESMCAGCSFYEIIKIDSYGKKRAETPCYDYARATRQTHGVWGGVRFEDGKVIRD